MHGDEKSDPSIVAGKPANGLGRPGPELVEQREGAKENTGQAGTRRTPSRASVSPGLDRVRTASPSNIQGGSRMRECRTSGSVRGVPSNGHPYRNPSQACSNGSTIARRNDGTRTPPRTQSPTLAAYCVAGAATSISGRSWKPRTCSANTLMVRTNRRKTGRVFAHMRNVWWAICLRWTPFVRQPEQLLKV